MTQATPWHVILDNALTQTRQSNYDLAERTKKSHQYVSAIRNGRMIPSDAVLMTLLQIVQEYKTLTHQETCYILNAVFEQALTGRFPESLSFKNQVCPKLDMRQYTTRADSNLGNMLALLPQHTVTEIERFADLLINVEPEVSEQIFGTFEMMVKGLR